MTPLKPGDTAPNFDLSSTEDVLLMLRDEVPRAAAVLYFFADPAAERARADLATLSSWGDTLASLRARAMGISPAGMPELKAVQRELGLSFPLLRDDRDFARYYGVVTPDEGAPDPALVAVGRRQEVLWLANPAPPVEQARADIEAALGALPSTAAGYPRPVVNRVVDWWVSRRRARA